MPSTFSRTLRFLDNDRRSSRLGGLLVFALLAGWTAWMLLARVTVYEVSASSRLEVQSSAHAVSTVVAGKITQTRLWIGNEVAEGDLLAVLDSKAEQRAIEEKQKHSEALRARLKALDHQKQEEQEELRAKVQARTGAVKETQALITAAEAKAVAAESARLRTEKLLAVHAASEQEMEQAVAESHVTKANVAALKLSIPRIEQDRTAEESESRTRVAQLEREAADLEGEAKVEQAAIRSLEQEIELRNIRAPVSGRVEEVVDFHVGSVVRAGDRLGTIVPPGKPRAVALFPAAAIGRIRGGQTARLRLDGFPWTQYGLLRGTVSAVGSEADGGLVRVELAIDSEPDSRIPVQHGLPCSVEIAVEQFSPAVLVLRAAGHFLAASRRVSGDRDELPRRADHDLHGASP